MSKPLCAICDQVVLVSKQRSTEGQHHPLTGKREHCHWHNDCAALERERVAMERLVALCGGDQLQAEQIRAELMNAPGALTLWKRSRHD